MVFPEGLRPVRGGVAPFVLGRGPFSLPGESFPDVKSGIQGIGVVWPEHLFPVGYQLSVALLGFGPTALPADAPVGHAPRVEAENAGVLAFGPALASAVI